ncbi:hypothetical protein LIPSTDRAFT_154946 [Lipomyces starkeyi NRRL Y-11557]|uniref:Uncharacterized protein n=1 Tax=Lipomyces starkeyi NRRL Y-11557 TaxID=675824 RepID=A0A1E3Q169_LIPST|nr:hypothetical protein LIPSTDRAFT_154946 [Lipomyces starkeyi NRRL Y-11557]
MISIDSTFGANRHNMDMNCTASLPSTTSFQTPLSYLLLDTRGVQAVVYPNENNKSGRRFL